jgi:hypothetical protein
MSRQLVNCRSKVVALAVGSFLAAAPVSAQQDSGTHWLLVPLFGPVATCAKIGPEMRQRLQASLAAGRARPNDVLPPAVWEAMQGLVDREKGAGGAPSPDLVRACDEAVAFFGSPLLPTYLRQMVAGFETADLAARCAVDHPALAGRVKDALLSAYARNRFQLTAAEIDEAVADARKTPGAAPVPQASCDQLLALLGGAEFDARFSEDGVRRFFADMR